MRNAIFGFCGMLVAVLIGLALFRQFGERETSLQRSTTDLDRTSALLKEDFVRTSDSLRTSVAEYYSNTGKLPEKNADVGVPEPDQFRGHTLKSATVLPGGVIEFVFDKNSGKDGGRIRLIADMEHAAAMGVQWHCQTSDYPFIKRVVPYCEYRVP